MKQCDDIPDLATHIADPCRLEALRAVALLDTPTEEAFDRLTRLAAEFASAPVALVTLIDANRQFFKSCLGLPEPWQSMRETPLSHSFCQYNRIPCKPLLIADARKDPMFKDNLAIRDLNVIAYLGIPLVTDDGYVLGSFCVIDSKPREWNDSDIKVVEELASVVMTEVHLRTEIATRTKTEEEMQAKNEELREAYRELERETAERFQALEQLRQREQMLVQQSRLAAMGEMIANIAHQWRQPLNMLALQAQELPIMLRAGQFNPQYLETSVQKMMEAISYMSRTIDNFRNFFSPGKEKVEFRVKETLDKTLSLLDVSLREAQITTKVVATSDPVVNGYPNEYSQVLLNILINAKDAFAAQELPDAAITIEVGTEEGKSVVVISDNAGGVPPDILHKIFDPYFTTKGPERGTGLGLYISKMIIEKNMDGSLTVENVNGGARFRIVL
jgi:signal transduction histidine kinase